MEETAGRLGFYAFLLGLFCLQGFVVSRFCFVEYQCVFGIKRLLVWILLQDVQGSILYVAQYSER